MSAFSRKKPFASKKLRYVLLAVSISPQLVLEEKPPPPDALYMLLNPLLCPQNPFFSPSPTQKNHPVLLFFARLNVLAVQTGVQFQPLHMNAPRPFRVGSVSSRLLCASGSGKQSLLSSSLLRGHCVIPYMDVG